MVKVVAASGYFDPLHVGHIEYLENSKKLGDKLVVIVNNDKSNLDKIKKVKLYGKSKKLFKKLLKDL